jgi:hypothetical protein
VRTLREPAHVGRLVAVVVADSAPADDGGAALSQSGGSGRKPRSNSRGIASTGCHSGDATHGARRTRHGRANCCSAPTAGGQRIARVSRTLARQIVSALAAAIALTLLVFLLIRMIPGDAITLWVGQEGSMPAQVQQTLRRIFGSCGSRPRCGARRTLLVVDDQRRLRGRPARGTPHVENSRFGAVGTGSAQA